MEEVFLFFPQLQPLAPLMRGAEDEGEQSGDKSMQPKLFLHGGQEAGPGMNLLPK